MWHSHIRHIVCACIDDMDGSLLYGFNLVCLHFGLFRLSHPSLGRHDNYPAKAAGINRQCVSMVLQCGLVSG